MRVGTGVGRDLPQRTQRAQREVRLLAQGGSGWYIRTAYIDYTGEKARLFPPTRHKVENKKDDGGAF